MITAPFRFKVSIFRGHQAAYAQFVTDTEEVTFETLKQFILSESWSPSIFTEKMADNGMLKRHRSNQDFEGAKIFAVDIDEGLSLQEAIVKVKSLGYQAMIGTTRNHGKEKNGKPACDRYRIIFLLDAVIQKENEYRAVFKTLQSIFPMCDKSCKDPARFFYPCKEIVFYQNGALFPVAETIQNVVEPLKSQNPELNLTTKSKENLIKKTLDFISFGAPDGEWHGRMIASLYDLKKNGFTQDEATALLVKASLSAHGKLDEKDYKQIHDIYHNRPVQVLNAQPLAKPQPLFREISKPEPFPIDALGLYLAAIIKALVSITKAPLALCAQSLLGAITLAVQPFRNVFIDGRSLPISQFFITIGDSGERKSAVDALTLKAHREFEKAELDAYKMDFILFSNQLEIYDIEKKKIINDKKMSKEERADRLNDLGIPPTPPPSRIMIIQEPTFEGVIKLYENGRPSVGLFSDEGGRMIGGYAMSADNQLKTMSGFSSLWDGKPLSKVRSEGGATNLYNKRFSIHLMLQSVVAELLLGNQMASGQGFLARCLIVFPTSTVGTRMYEAIDAETNIDLTLYYKQIKKLLSTPMPLNPDDARELTPTNISLTDSAKKIWEEFHDSIEINLGEGGKFYSIREFGAKAAEHSLRMAAVLTLFENIESVSIDEVKMRSATALVKYYLYEALRLNNMAQIPQELQTANKLLNWLKKQPDRYIYPAKVYRKGPNSIRDKNAAKLALKTLEEHGHLVKCSNPMELDKALRKEVWEIIREENT